MTAPVKCPACRCAARVYWTEIAADRTLTRHYHCVNRTCRCWQQEVLTRTVCPED